MLLLKLPEYRVVSRVEKRARLLVAGTAKSGGSLRVTVSFESALLLPTPPPLGPSALLAK